VHISAEIVTDRFKWNQCSGRKAKASPGERGQKLSPSGERMLLRLTALSSMDPAAPEPQVDFTIDRDGFVDSENTSKGHMHRGLDESLG